MDGGGGVVVRPGAILYRVDTRPVFWLSGGQPAWRTLEDGIDDGLDVRQLEQNLVALGFDPDREIDVDTEFDDATEDAIERWQEKTHQEETGKVELGTVVFLPGQTRRIAEVQGTVGGGAGGAILSTTSTRREATFEIDARDAGQVQEGKSVQVELPDGTIVRRHDRAASAAWPRAAATTRPPRATPTIEVTVRLDAGQDRGRVRPGARARARRDRGGAGRAGGPGRRPAGAGRWRLRAGAGRLGSGWCRSRSAPSPTASCRSTGEGIDEGTRVVEADL